MNHPEYLKRLRSQKLWLVIVKLLFIVVIVACLAWYVNVNINKTPKQSINREVAKLIKISLSGINNQPAEQTRVPLPEFVPDYTIPPIRDGMAPVVTNIPTSQKVVFLSIDDGAFKDQSVIDILQKNYIKASLFLSKAFIAGNPSFFEQIIAQGSLVEDHTLTHDLNMVKDETYDQQKNEICGMADYEESQYGRRPIFFRPPGGAYSDTMRQAAADCGMKAVVTWIAKANAGSMQYQIGNKLRPGDIVLMHFRPEFASDMKAFIDAQNAAGLHTELLEDLVVSA
jgi:peptidoglycan/xylan/chitin deacetylase (PgdA/CDA1 family)